MNEFYKPDRKYSDSFSKQSAETAYDEPSEETIRIVVDDNNDDAGFCTKCGSRLDAGDAFCGKCGAPIDNRQLQKSSSGTFTVNQTESTYYNTYNDNSQINTDVNFYGKLKDKHIAILLCVLFGTFGAHRFYEGKIASGILYACTAGLGGIGWVIDLIILLGKPRYYNP